MSWPYSGYSIVNENGLREERKTQRDLLPIAKRISEADPGPYHYIVNPKGIGTSYVWTNEEGRTYHIKTDRKGYDTTWTEI